LGGSIGGDKEGTGMEELGGVTVTPDGNVGGIEGGARVAADGNVGGIEGGARVAADIEDGDGCVGKMAADSILVTGGARIVADRGGGP
ncbi:MAG: hypothetical protein ACJ71K_00925, partial [Nitrososphaeraceae archaeon]